MNRFPSSPVVGVLVVVLASLGCMALQPNRVQGSGVAKAEQREVGEFQRISINGAADVRVTIGAQRSLSIETDDNVLPLITTDVKDGELIIDNTETYNTKLGVRVTITTPDLSGVSINGAGDVNIDGLNGERFSADINGSGDMTVTGAVQSVDIDIHGSGDLKLGDLHAKTANISVAGSGDVTVSASDQLNVSVAGSGDVKYKGDPKVRKSIAGSGSVRKVG